MNTNDQNKGKLSAETQTPTAEKPKTTSVAPSPKKKGLRPGTILFLVVMVVLLGLAGFLIGKIRKAREKKPAAAVVAEVSIPVHVAQVATGTVEDIVYVTGSVEYAERVEVIAKIPTPGKLIEAHVKKGEAVEKDQLLATVHRDEIGVVYMPYKVKAPVAGTIASIIDSPGSLITAQRPVAVIINTGQVKIKSSVVDADLKRIKEGIPARVRVDAYSDRVFEGTLSRIEPVLDAVAHTAPVEITLDNSDRALIPGMFGRIELVADVHSDVPMIPKAAVFKKQGKDYCFVVKEEEKQVKGKTTKIWRIYLTELKLGYYDQTKYEVVEGVQAGDLVVDEDLAVLKDKTVVAIANLEEVMPSMAGGATVQPSATAAPLPGTTAPSGGTTPAAGSTTPTAPSPGATAPATPDGNAPPSETPAVPDGGTPLRAKKSDSHILLPPFQEEKSILDEPPPSRPEEDEPAADGDGKPAEEEKSLEEILEEESGVQKKDVGEEDK